MDLDLSLTIEQYIFESCSRVWNELTDGYMM